MATPSRAPRRTATQMTTSIANGIASPGANTYQVQRKTASVSDASKAGNAAGTPVGLTPNNVSVNK